MTSVSGNSSLLPLQVRLSRALVFCAHYVLWAFEKPIGGATKGMSFSLPEELLECLADIDIENLAKVAFFGGAVH